MLAVFVRMLALLLSALFVVAPAGAEGGKRVALVIANSAYRNVPVLANPAADATLIATTLRKAGFTSVDVVQNLDKSSLEAALQQFGDKADSADVAMVYYAGHGIEIAGQNYLVPVTARLLRDRDVSVEATSLDTVLSLTAGARMRVVVLDACRENPFAVNMARTGSGRSVGRGLARVEPEGDTLVVYSAKAGAIAADGDGRNSPFAQALARRLPEPGVEIGLTFRHVRDDVITATGRRQEPFTYGSLSGASFYFVPATVGADRPIETGGISSDTLAWQSAMKVDTVAAYKEYLRLFPAGTFAGMAQSSIDKLTPPPTAAVAATTTVPMPVGEGMLSLDQVRAIVDPKMVGATYVDYKMTSKGRKYQLRYYRKGYLEAVDVDAKSGAILAAGR